MEPREETTQPSVWDLVTLELPCRVAHWPAPPCPQDAPFPHLLCGTEPLLFLSGPQFPYLPIVGDGPGYLCPSTAQSSQAPTKSPLSGKRGAEVPSSGSHPGQLHSSHPLSSQCPQKAPSEKVLAVKARWKLLSGPG